MESLEVKIKKFLTLNHGDGGGYGGGDGSGYGDGDGGGDGDGYGGGYGYGGGDGYGDGGGYGGGYGDGYGYGYGDGYGLLSFLGKKVHYVDGIATCFYSVVGYTAKGFIINTDLTTKDCYIVRVGNSFAHGETKEEAYRDAEKKHLLDSPAEERVKLFLEVFKGKEPIPAKDLFDWHYNLTGSCEMGRNQFVRDKSIDLENDSFTIHEFINITRNAYGSEVIKELEKQFNQ